MLLQTIVVNILIVASIDRLICPRRRSHWAFLKSIDPEIVTRFYKYTSTISQVRVDITMLGHFFAFALASALQLGHYAIFY